MDLRVIQKLIIIDFGDELVIGIKVGEDIKDDFNLCNLMDVVVFIQIWSIGKVLGFGGRKIVNFVLDMLGLYF